MVRTNHPGCSRGVLIYIYFFLRISNVCPCALIIFSVPNMSCSVDTMHAMHTFLCEFHNYRSSHDCTSRRNCFFSHPKTGAQSIRNSCMSTDSEVIAFTKGHYAFGFMQMNTARKICRGGDALSCIDVLKKVLGFELRTTPNAKMKTTNCGKMTSSGR